MSDKLYNVVFNGTILPGQSKEEVKKKLAMLFKVDQQKIESYFSSKPVVVKSKVSKQVCDQYTAAFKKAGAQCMIKPVTEAKVPAAKPAVEASVVKPQKPTPQALSVSSVRQSDLTSQKPKAGVSGQPQKSAVQPKPVSQEEPDLLEGFAEQEQNADATIEMLKKKYQVTDQDNQGDTTSKAQQKQPYKNEDLFSAWNEELDDTSNELDRLFSNLTTISKDKDSQQPPSDKGMTGTVQFDDVEELVSRGFDTDTKTTKSLKGAVSDDLQGDLDDLFSSFSSQKGNSKGNVGSDLEDFDKGEHGDESTQFMLQPHLAIDKTDTPSQKEEKEEESTQFMFPPNVTAKDNDTRRRDDSDRTIEAPPFFDSKDFFGSSQDDIGTASNPSVLKPKKHTLFEEDTAFKASTDFGVTQPKTKRTALLLALVTAPLAWLYTYKQDLKKFWINIGLSVITAGLWGIVAWIWAIIDIARRPEEFYSSIEEDDKLGLIALITGVFGIFGGFIPAIVCGYVHLSRIKKSGGKLPGKRFALIGLILGIVPAVLLMTMIVLFAIYMEQVINFFMMLLGQGIEVG
jgi:hypothetical protein